MFSSVSHFGLSTKIKDFKISLFSLFARTRRFLSLAPRQTLVSMHYAGVSALLIFCSRDRSPKHEKKSDLRVSFSRHESEG